MSIQTLISRKKLGRKVKGIAAALLPYADDGKPAVGAFQQHLLATQHAGLMNAVNMDTGYVNHLSIAERQEVLRWTRDALGSAAFVAGAYIENQEGNVITLYREQMDGIVELGGIPIIFQTARLQGRSAKEKAEIYREIARGYPSVLAFELGKMFAPNGEIWG